jgi:hypothetical protein
MVCLDREGGRCGQQWPIVATSTRLNSELLTHVAITQCFQLIGISSIMCRHVLPRLLIIGCLQVLSGDGIPRYILLRRMPYVLINVWRPALKPICSSIGNEMPNTPLIPQNVRTHIFLCFSSDAERQEDGEVTIMEFTSLLLNISCTESTHKTVPLIIVQFPYSSHFDKKEVKILILCKGRHFCFMEIRRLQYPRDIHYTAKPWCYIMNVLFVTHCWAH